MNVDVIVNAANRALSGGGGVDGAIHRAAGPELLQACRQLGVCETGQAKITLGYNLPAKYVIHTVGPVWDGGEKKETQQLASCYQESLKLAALHNLKTIAFPAISCGAYRFPIELAAQIAIQEIIHFLTSNSTLEKVYLVCFDSKTYHGYQKITTRLQVEKGIIN
jgi:O-acetyl-ADP-ribose deacetylase (regulator of RNase III)